MNAKGFIIHLKRATARRPHVERLQTACPAPAEIVDAVDGNELSAGELATVYTPNLHQPAYPFPLRPAEIGCFLSHRRCWQKIVDENLPHALVFEDDASLDMHIAANALRMAESRIQDFGYIQLPVRPISSDSKIVAKQDGTQILRPVVIPLRLSGQVISQSAARDLLRLTTVFDRPVDTFLQMHWLTGVRPLAVEPSGLSDCTQDAGGSTISRNKGVGERVVREVKRYWYRSRIKSYSNKFDGAAQ